MRALMASLVLTACGSGEPPRVRSGPPAAMIATPAGGDEIVATVADRPVWGHCVAQQMARGAATREAARQECIAFELLAQEAEKRGLATDPEVVDETRRALVERLVAVEFESRYRSPDDVRAELDRALSTMPDQLPEIRTAAHALIKVEKDAPADVVENRRRIAAQIHAALADETGLTLEHVRAIAEPIAKQAGALEHLHVGQEPPYTGQRNWDGRFVKALLEIPEVGRASPVTRTRDYGWHVIVLVEKRPALTRAEVEQRVFFAGRLQKFVQWTDELVQKHGIAIEKFENRLEDSTR